MAPGGRGRWHGALALALLLLRAAEGGEEGQRRRLVVAGEAARVEDYPFVAMLIYCALGAECVNSTSTNVAGTCRCRTFCSGALVAPGAVLTAAHCFWNAQNRSELRPGLALGEEGGAFVVLGHETLAAARPDSFFLVSDVVHGGYQNIAQSKDNDIALVFLSTCALGRATVKVGTSMSMGGGDACTQVTGLGWGRQDSFDNFWGVEAAAPLKRTVDFFIHSWEVCTTEYRRAAVDMIRVLPFYDYDASQLEYFDRTLDVSQEFSPDRHLCYGASSAAGMCHGDSGGPVVARDANGSAVLLAVNGWMMNKCGIYADFGARVAFFAPWMREELERRPDALCGTALSSAFASWPPSAWRRSEADSSTRCFVQGDRWACRNSTGNVCIDWSQRCNGAADCPDGSDEGISAGCGRVAEELPRAADCQAVLDKLASSFQVSEAAWWPLQDAIELHRPGADGVMTVSNHGEVAEACNKWLTQAANAVRLRTMTSSERALLSACKGNATRDNDMRAASRVYANRANVSFLKEVFQVAAMCQSQILYVDLYLEGRASLHAEFAQERQRCPSLLASANLTAGTAGAGTAPSRSFAVALALALALAGGAPPH